MKIIIPLILIAGICNSGCSKNENNYKKQTISLTNLTPTLLKDGCTGVTVLNSYHKILDTTLVKFKQDSHLFVCKDNTTHDTILVFQLNGIAPDCATNLDDRKQGCCLYKTTDIKSIKSVDIAVLDYLRIPAGGKYVFGELKNISE
ncbi:hypothetical protein [Mucilaginibacter sp. SJ]|uniref:hypothetical protein n=1 Tax=Mucilaginibacter sp. SJ TaxID=3029053 RepID=UPI0023A99B0B|nr:hypothetical protein [Mucilaginibacter sp. SJ]WEA00661.1 hypothetical protein MusilaSJ_24710 [Mucilaginibacter sp. SJ]